MARQNAQHSTARHAARRTTNHNTHTQEQQRRPHLDAVLAVGVGRWIKLVFLSRLKLVHTVAAVYDDVAARRQDGVGVVHARNVRARELVEARAGRRVGVVAPYKVLFCVCAGW